MIRRLMAAPLVLAVVLAPVAFAASSCACGTGTAAAGPTGSGGCGSSHQIQSCSPQATESSNTMGTIGVAQNGSQQTVFWQVRATLLEGVYKVTVKINGKVVDDKPAQAYPPHGTVALKTHNSQGLPSGGLFAVSGTFSPPKDDPQEFYIQCLLA